MKVALFALGASMVVATALPLLRSDRWWIRIFDFPRIQITFLLALALTSYPFFAKSYGAADYLLLAALAACLAYQGFMMFPYTPLARKQVQWSRGAREGRGFSLLFANVLMDNRNAERLKELIRQDDPDIILAVETDGWWEERLREFERTHPFVVRRPQDNTYGMLLYSRLELVEPEVKFLVQDDIPSIHGRVRLPGGQEVGLHCLHPRPPFPTEDDSATGRDAELLIVGRSIKEEEPIPIVVLGDLNDVAWSRTNYLFKDVSGLLDPRIGRGFSNTFHAKYPFIRFPLDHFFHSNHFRLVDFRRLGYFGSDHFPVFISLSYEPDAEVEQPELRATREEQEEATEKIEKAT